MRISDWSSDVCSSDLLDAFSRDAVPDAVREWIQDLRAAIAEGRLAAQELSDRLESLAHRATTLAHEMDFALLFDPATRLFHIGYNLSADRIDPHQYDLLASEARLASYFAIAKGDIATDT